MSSKIPIKLKSASEKTITPSAPLLPQGLYYVPNFLTSEESQSFLSELESQKSWVGVTASQKSRRVIHYGYIYSYIGGPLQPTDPIPKLYQSIVTRFKKFITENIPPESFKKTFINEGLEDPPQVPPFDQLIINEYLPGQGISAHTDHTTKFGSIIACITLGSGVEIEFTRPGYDPVKIYVEPNSLYIMSDDARYLWKHAIAQRKSDVVNNKIVQRGTRISLTFREALA